MKAKTFNSIGRTAMMCGHNMDHGLNEPLVLFAQIELSQLSIYGEPQCPFLKT